MNESNSLTHACYDALLQTLGSLLLSSKSLVDAPRVIGRLDELVAGLPGGQADSGETSPASATLSSAVGLANAAQGMLNVLDSSGAGDSIDAQSREWLSQALESLAGELGATLRRQQANRIRGLYVIVDPEVTGGRDPLDIGKAAVAGGAKMLQLRDKLRDKGEILPLARDLQELCLANDVLLIINDHVDLAAAVGSGGVHVGQTDLPVVQARQVLAPHQVLGRSNRELDLLVESQQMGADHVAFGAIYPTTTKGGGRGPQGPARLREAREVTKVPLVAIGGINAENVAPVVEAGADAICVTAAVGSAPDPEAAANRLVEAIRAAGGKV
jgi:thiamine-phosphate pyrophosphorylase